MTLIFLWLDDPARAVGRVAQRVAEGGHDIPREVIVRRYWAGLRNLMGMYLPLADAAQIYDHSDGMGVLIASKPTQTQLVIHDGPRWARLREAVDEGLDERRTA